VTDTPPSFALSAASPVLHVLVDGTSAATGDDFFRSFARPPRGAGAGRTLRVRGRDAKPSGIALARVSSGPVLDLDARGAAQMFNLTPSTARSRMKNLGLRRETRAR
jgi:hypothetical protein